MFVSKIENQDGKEAIVNVRRDDDTVDHVDFRNGYTEQEYEKLIALIDELSSLFYGSDGNAYEGTVGELYNLVALVQARRKLVSTTKRTASLTNK